MKKNLGYTESTKVLMSEAKHNSLVDILQNRTSNTPTRPIYTFLDAKQNIVNTLTFKELTSRAIHIASLLQAQNLKGERVLLAYAPGLEFIEAFFGCFFAGVVAVPVSPLDPVRLMRSLPRLRNITDDAEARCLLTTSEMAKLKSQVSKESPEMGRLEWIITDDTSRDESASWSPQNPKGEDAAFLQYTSGSTAKPRGVQISHANLMANEAFIAKACGLSESDRGVSWLPMHHDMGLIGSVLQPLYSGFPVRFLSPITFIKKPLSWLRAISEFKATISPAPNFAFSYCSSRVKASDVATLDLSHWRCALNGAEPINADIIEEFAKTFGPAGFQKSAFYPCYGLAEATLLVSGAKSPGSKPTTVPVLKEAFKEGRVDIAKSNSTDAVQSLIACGKFDDGHHVAIVDPSSGKEKGPDEIGEIWVSSPSIASGYWRRKEENSATFGATVPSHPGRSFLRTGDLGFIFNDELVVTGRSKDLIIIRGKNHYPQDIELSVEDAHSTIVPGAVIAFSIDLDGEEKLALAVELKTKNPKPEVLEEIVDLIREVVARNHEVLAHTIAFVTKRSLPKTSSGKLQRRKCKAQFESERLSLIHCAEDASPSEAASGKYLSNNKSVDAESQNRVSASELDDEVREWLTNHLSKHLKLKPSEIDPNKNFDTYGLDSHIAVELLDEMEEWFGFDLDSMLFFKYPTIALLTAHLTDLRSKTETGE